MWINLTDAELEMVKQALSRKLSFHLVSSQNDEVKAVQALQDRIKELETEYPEDQAFRNAHRERYSIHPWTDGDIDIDEHAMVSRGDDGAYVMMWGYVRNDEAGIPQYATWKEAAQNEGWEEVEDPEMGKILFNKGLERFWPINDWEGAALDAGVEPEEVAEEASNRCRTCGEEYAEGGDGFDGECPDCADKTDQKLHPENYE